VIAARPESRYVDIMRVTLILLALATPVLAEPVPYTLDAGASSVGFVVNMGDQAVNGTMPISAAGLLLDFDRVSNSTINVTLDPSRAQTGLIFATEALKAENLLNTASFPHIDFVSTTISVGADATQAEVDGMVTIRGVTKPLHLHAQLYRQAGTIAGNIDKLSLLLTGTLNRNDFGAAGYPGMVSDQVTLNITAQIDRTP
jgi:polyisoprenoid-binding protein YceI